MTPTFHPHHGMQPDPPKEESKPKFHPALGFAEISPKAMDIGGDRGLG